MLMGDKDVPGCLSIFARACDCPWEGNAPGTMIVGTSTSIETLAAPGADRRARGSLMAI